MMSHFDGLVSLPRLTLHTTDLQVEIAFLDEHTGRPVHSPHLDVRLVVDGHVALVVDVAEVELPGQGSELALV